MEDGEQKTAPLISFTVYVPFTEEQYLVLVDMDLDYDINYYYTLEDLMIAEGINSDYTTDQLSPFIDLYAN